MSSPPRPPKIPSSALAGPAFGAPSRPSRRHAPSDAEPSPSDQGSEMPVSLVDATVFEPDPEQVEKLKKKSVNVQAKTEAKTRQEAIQAVHVMHLLAPAICRAMAEGASEDQQVQYFMEQTVQARAAAARMVDAWKVPEDDKDWVAAAMERVFMEHPALLGISDMTGILNALPGQAPPPPSPWLSPPVAAGVAMLNALGSVAQAQMEFNLSRKNPEADLQAATRVLAEAAQDAVMELADPTSTADVRTTIFSAALQEAGKAMAWLWRAHGERLREHANARSKAEQEIWKRAHPEGEDLDPVFRAFSDHSARLRRLARLARPR